MDEKKPTLDYQRTEPPEGMAKALTPIDRMFGGIFLVMAILILALALIGITH